MTALVGVFGQRSADARDELPAMFEAMRNRASGPLEVGTTPGAVLAASRHAWQLGVDSWIGPLVVQADDWTIAADASLYYIGDLRRRLARHGSHAPRTTTAELLLASLRTWGDRFARFIEGDFAVIAHDRLRDRVLLARDFAGSRSLAWARVDGGSLVVATSPLGVVAHGAVSRRLDADFVGAAAAGLVGHGYGTAFADVSVVPGGATLAFADGRITVADRLPPPTFSGAWEDAPSNEAADELRRLLEQAVLERLPQRGSAVVWMSGGWDSTSVFAAGRSAIQRSGSPVTLEPISVRYPQGDRGDESHFVQAISDRWNARVRWVPVDEIPLIDDVDARARKRDDPRVQPFESMARVLSRTGLEDGARVVLDGVGGDHLFSVSGAAALSDHLFHGRWPPLVSAWRTWGLRRPRGFLRAVLLPQLSRGTLEWLGSVRGRPLSGFWDADLPPWMVPTPGLLAQLTPEFERDASECASAYESRRALTMPLVARALAWNQAIAADEGVSIRSPLMDWRLIQFAAGRPLSDRSGGPDSKLVLRQAMRRLIPTEVLQPRGEKTGTPVDYFRRQLQPVLQEQVHQLFVSRESILVGMGLVRPDRLAQAVAQYNDTGVHGVGAKLHITLEAERWLATHAWAG